MYETLDDIKNQIEVQFKDTLGKTVDNIATYSHTKALNGIGCAIGCLFNESVAHKLEEIAIISEHYSISSLHHYSQTLPDDYYKQFLRINVFSKFNFKNYSINDLRQLQIYHDSVNKVLEFLIPMRKMKANVSNKY